MFVQHHQAVHLTAAANTGDTGCIVSRQQFRHSLIESSFPVLRILLTPARLRKLQRIFLGNSVVDRTMGIHQKQFHGRGS